MTQSTPNEAAMKQQRAQKLAMFAAIIAVLAILYIAYWLLYASHFVATDNAYTNAEVAAITPAIPGTVAEVLVSDTEAVRAGQLLVKIDPIDAELAVAQAEADLERAIRQVKSAQANDRSLTAQISAREADLKRAEAGLSAAKADFERADVEYNRRQALIKSGSVSGDELTLAKNAYIGAKAQRDSALAAEQQARANLETAKQAKAANYVWISEENIDDNPDVKAAATRLKQAKVNLARTELRSPVDGLVGKRRVQVGEQVQPGAPLMIVVPTNDIYVDANFKEVQLEKVKVGQPVAVHADIYGDDVTYDGIVAGFSGGSGSAFAAIPAQNATGNWIKVVQRLPVRIHLDASQLQQHPLKVGLSMAVEIDTRRTVVTSE